MAKVEHTRVAYNLGTINEPVLVTLDRGDAGVFDVERDPNIDLLALAFGLYEPVVGEGCD